MPGAGLRRATVWCVGVAAVLVFAGAVRPAVAAGAILRLRADQDRVPADGKSQVAILAEVTDSLGLPVPDGTRVHFSTTLGRIVTPVQTVGGLAQTVLTAPLRPGVAVVSAMFGASRASLQVEFVPTGAAAQRSPRVVELVAEEVAYSADRRVFVATENAELRLDALLIRADGLQYDMDRGLVYAQGNVSLQAGPRLVMGDALRYDLATMRGDLLRVGDETPRILVEGEELQERAGEESDPWPWEPMETGDTRTWVKAKRAIVYPGEKVILDYATFYVRDAPVMSLRRHVLDPSLGAAVFGDTLRYSSASGVALDLPWYYRASAARVGSLHLTRNRTVDGTAGLLGWAVGLREDYFRGDEISGALILDDLREPQRGLHWSHAQPLGSLGQLSLQAEAVTLEEDAARFRNASLNFYRPLEQGAGLSLTLSHVGYGGSEHSHGDLTYALPQVRAGERITISPALHLRHSRAENTSADVLVDTSTGEPLVMEDRPATRSTSLALDLNLRAAPIRVGGHAQLTSQLTTGYVKVFSGEGQGVLDLRLALDYRFSARSGPGPGRATLTYSFSANPSAGQVTLFTAPRQMLSLTTTFRALGCSITGTASEQLEGGRRYGSLQVVRPLPFGRDASGAPLWSLRLTHFYSRADRFSASHTRLSLSRRLGRFLASLCYSPQGAGDFESRPWISASGYGYTYAGGSHFWVELSLAQD